MLLNMASESLQLIHFREKLLYSATFEASRDTCPLPPTLVVYFEENVFSL